MILKESRCAVPTAAGFLMQAGAKHDCESARDTVITEPRFHQMLLYAKSKRSGSAGLGRSSSKEDLRSGRVADKDPVGSRSNGRKRGKRGMAGGAVRAAHRA